jgi:hypothetical protein
VAAGQSARLTGNGDGGDDLDERRGEAYGVVASVGSVWFREGAPRFGTLTLVESTPALELITLPGSVSDTEVRLRVSGRALRLEASPNEVSDGGAGKSQTEGVAKQCDRDLQWIDTCCGCAQVSFWQFCVRQDLHSLEAPTPPLIAPNAKLPATPGSSPAHCVYASLIPSKVDMSIAEYGNTPIKPAGKPRKKYRNRPRDHMSRAVCRIRAFPRAWPPEEDMTRVCRQGKVSVFELAQSHCRVLWTRLEGLDRVNAWVVGFLGLAFGGSRTIRQAPDSQNWLMTPPIPPATNRLELEIMVWSGTLSQYCANTRFADSYDRNLIADSCSCLWSANELLTIAESRPAFVPERS